MGNEGCRAMSMTERELVSRAQAGDQYAFGQLASGQVDRLFATAFLILRSRESARDAAQEALLDAWRGLPTLRDPERFGPWLHRLLVHACSRQARRMPRDIALDQLIGPFGLDESGMVANRDQLERGFRRLSTDQRAILVLRFYLDLSVDAVAGHLGLPIGTVKSRTNRALAAMRASLEADARLVPGPAEEATS